MTGLIASSKLKIFYARTPIYNYGGGSTTAFHQILHLSTNPKFVTFICQMKKELRPPPLFFLKFLEGGAYL